MNKKFTYRINTSWLPGSGIMAITSFVLFSLALGILIINLEYNNALSSNANASSSIYDSSAFPLAMITAVFGLFISIYYCFNSMIWFMSFKKGLGNRKKFNLIAFLFSAVSSLTFLIDTLMRLYAVSTNFYDYTILNSTSPPLVVQNIKTSGFWIFQPYMLITIGSISFLVYSTVYYFQKKLYIEEIVENSKKEVRDHYRELEKKEKIKFINKNKKKIKDLSGDIKVF